MVRLCSSWGIKLGGGEQHDEKAEEPDRSAAEVLHEFDLRVEQARRESKPGGGKLGNG